MDSVGARNDPRRNSFLYMPLPPPVNDYISPVLYTGNDETLQTRLIRNIPLMSDNMTKATRNNNILLITGKRGHSRSIFGALFSITIRKQKWKILTIFGRNESIAIDYTNTGDYYHEGILYHILFRFDQCRYYLSNWNNMLFKISTTTFSLSSHTYAIETPNRSITFSTHNFRASFYVDRFYDEKTREVTLLLAPHIS